MYRYSSHYSIAFNTISKHVLFARMPEWMQNVPALEPGSPRAPIHGHPLHSERPTEVKHTAQ